VDRDTSVQRKLQKRKITDSPLGREKKKKGKKRGGRKHNEDAESKSGGIVQGEGKTVRGRGVQENGL